MPKRKCCLAAPAINCSANELWEEFPELTGSPFEANYRKVMAEQVAVEFEASDPAGKVWYEVHAYPSNGGVSVFFRDISERKRIEAERLTTSKLESLGTLAGGIAHDLNNILTVISGNIGLAQIEAPPDAGILLWLPLESRPGRAARGASLQPAPHLFEGRRSAEKGRFSLESCSNIQAEFSLYGSNLRADFDIAVDLWKAEVDAGQIEQVVNALMLNAREAMPHGGTVRVRARNVFSRTNRAPSFRRATTSRSRSPIAAPGSRRTCDARSLIPISQPNRLEQGLGLSISYSIVKKHGGLLHLESSSPEGSAFAFYLPASDPARSRLRKSQRSGTHVPLQSSTRPGHG